MAKAREIPAAGGTPAQIHHGSAPFLNNNKQLKSDGSGVLSGLRESDACIFTSVQSRAEERAGKENRSPRSNVDHIRYASFLLLVKCQLLFR
jgi:hypothetical protein